MRERKCATTKCQNIVLVENGYRKFCDSCLKLHKDTYRRKWQKKKYQTFAAYRKQQAEKQRKWRQKNIDFARNYNRDWMRKKRAGEKTKGLAATLTKKPAVVAISHSGECLNCGLRMFEYES